MIAPPIPFIPSCLPLAVWAASSQLHKNSLISGFGAVVRKEHNPSLIKASGISRIKIVHFEQCKRREKPSIASAYLAVESIERLAIDDLD